MKQRFNANISIRAADQGTVLSALSLAVADLKLSIVGINGRIDKNRDAIVDATISISDTAEIELLIRKMQGDKRIYEVHRITSSS